MKKYLALFIAVTSILTSCLKDDVEGLQKQIDDLENRTSNLEKEIKAYSDLQNAHIHNLHITNIVSQENGTTLIMNDGTQIFIPNSKSVTPYVGENGNWWIDGKDTGSSSKGENGIDGLIPHIGENGNWWIGDIDTGNPSTGNKGNDGISPHIGENGNWWIGDDDTGISSKGENGISPHIGENGNWWIGTDDTGVLASAPTIISIQYIDGDMVYYFSDGSSLKLIIDNKEEIDKQKNWKAVAVDGGYTLITYTGTNTKVIVPNTIYGKPVVELGIRDATSKELGVVPIKMRLLITEFDLSKCLHLKSINNFALTELLNISEIILPESLLNIGYNSFDGCDNLTMVTILKETHMFTTCETNSFQNTPIKTGKQESKIIFPIGKPYPSVNYWNSNLAEFYDSEGNSYGIPNGTIVTEGDWIGVKIPNGVQLTEYLNIKDKIVVIPNKLQGMKVLSIGLYSPVTNGYANIFQDGYTKYYTSIDMSNCIYLETITNNAFDGFKNFGDLTLPSTIKTIGPRAFRGCHFSSISFPDNLETIGKESFAWVDIEHITFPNKLRSIGKLSFAESYITSVILPKELTTIEMGAFAGCRVLKSVEFPEKLINIDRMAFWRCEELTAINLPESLVNIGEEAFSRCQTIKTVILPSKVESISRYAFGGCTSLSTLIIKKSTNPLTTCSSNSFDNSPINSGYNDAKIYYPDGTAYPTEVGWNLNKAQYIVQ